MLSVVVGELVYRLLSVKKVVISKMFVVNHVISCYWQTDGPHPQNGPFKTVNDAVRYGAIQNSAVQNGAVQN